jgi:hypothetical protein
MRISRKLPIFVAPAVALVSLALGVHPVFAAGCSTCKPWWELSVDSAPAVLRTGQATDEVQEVTVSATGGSFTLITEAFPIDELIGSRHTFEWDATHQEVQKGLEEMYGAGNVEVPSGQGNAAGGDPYRIIWKGEFADHSLLPLRVDGGTNSGHDPSLSGGREEVLVKEVTKGRSDATLILTAANMGDADLAGPVKIAAKLPSGLTPVSIHGSGGFGDFTRLECSLGALSCTYEGSTVPDGEVQLIIPVNVSADAKTGEPVELLISGGNAPPAKASRGVVVGSAPPAFGAENYEMTAEEEGGASDTQAGSHPFQLTTTLMLNAQFYENVNYGELRPDPTGQPKNLVFKLPPGLVGNPTQFPQCTAAQFDDTLKGDGLSECGPETAVGVAAITITGPGKRSETPIVPVFNLTPSAGEPARFGFTILRTPIYLNTSVRTGDDYGVTVTVANTTQTVTFVSSRVTFWGVPGDPRHDGERGWSCVEDEHKAPQTGTPCVATHAKQPPPFLELPTSCTGPMQTTMEVDSWEQQDSFSSTLPTSALPSLDGCNALPFSPSISVAPDGQAGSTPTGLTVGIHVPQQISLDGEGLGEADVKETTVALPTGVALNPAAADGLQACSEAQVALSVDSEASCPEASKVATLEIKSPLLVNPLTGEAYLAAQNANPFGSLVAMYLVAKDPVSGTLIKLAGEVQPNPLTGQLVSTFKNTPQLPFEDLTLHFFGGDRAPLGTPALCGAYTTTASIAPWSGNQPAEPSSTFDVTSGPNGSSCQNPLPFAPSLTSGSPNINAGSFTPLTTTITREDGQQNIQSVQLHYPPGLSGVLAGVKLCPEAQANAGTCGPESKIGSTIVSVGLGGDPYSVTGGEVFLTEKIAGSPVDAPFGLSIVNPAVAGPYNLGKVIVRATIEVDPHTSALTITTDSSGPYAIPHILDGIPLQIKHVNVTVERPGFTFNPTDCDKQAITGTIGSSEGASAPVSTPFQVTNCAALKFAPKFAVSTSGKTSKAKGASLSVKLTYPKTPQGTEANIARVKVDLPKQLPSRLTTLQKACTAKQFEANPAGCPSASVVGHAKAITPILPVPLEGPAYFVSHGGEAFPSLIVVLQGYGVTVDLVGTTFISHAGITSSTFKTVPDVPVGSFELILPEGKFSALAANGSLCKSASKLAMPTAFVAQNGMEIHQSTAIGVTGCARVKSLTRKQKLAAALKACQRDRDKAKRVTCLAGARRRYGPLKKGRKK